MHAHEFWTDRLSEALDGTLPPEQRAGLEEHLEACAACQAVRDELAEVRRRARALGAVPPEADLWARIAPALEGRGSEGKVIPMHPGGGAASGGAEGGSRSARRVALAPLSAAAAVVLLLGAGAMGGALVTRSQASSPTAEPVAAMDDGSAEIRLAAGGAVEPSLFAELYTLEEALRSDLSHLDPETRAVIVANLETIDRAIRESVGALRADPESRYLQGHLGSALQRKVGYLQSVTRLLES